MERTILSLHPAQQDIYTDQLIDLSSSRYNIGGYIKLKGSFNKEKFHEAVNSAPAVFDVFKMRFDLYADESFCYFDEDFEKLALADLDFSDSINPAEEATYWMQGRFDTPFPLQKDSLLFEHSLIKISADEYWFFGRYHHLITDGYGFIVFVQYVAQKYKSLITGDYTEFKYPSYQEELIKANESIHSADYESDAAYWKEKVNTKPQKLLQRKYPRENIPGKRGSTYILNLTEEQRKLLEEIQLLTKSGLQQLTIAALLIYFGKTSNQQEFIFGIPVHKRTSKRLRNIVGTFTGLLPFKGIFQADQKLAAFLREIMASQKSDYRHQHYLIGELTRHLKINATEGYLSDIIVNYEPLFFELDFGDKVQATIARLTNNDELNPLKVVWRDYSTQQPLQLHIHFSNEYFATWEIELLVERLLFILEQFPAKLEDNIGNIQVLPAGERSLLEKFTDSAVDYPKGKTIIDLFQAQVLTMPESEALLFGVQRLTYRELNERSNQLAHYLKSQGVKRETLVAICIERSVEMIVAILGILKAGAAYLPIDPDYPNERISYILEDSEVEILLTSKTTRLKLPVADINLVEIDGDQEIISSYPAQNMRSAIEPNQLAYVIYTSGSTGKPKGVMIEHKGIVNLSLNQAAALQLKPGMKTLQFASFGFDASCYEIFNTLLSGGCLVLCTKEDILSAEGFEAVINMHRVELAVLPPSYQHIIADNLGTIKTIVSAGEPLNEVIGLHMQSRGIRLINAYGPTENTVCVTLTDDPVKDHHTIVIGKPISNVQVYVLDSRDELSPLGSVGEICVGGAQVARGYLNRPELTGEKFISNPFSKDPRSKLYKTGDLGRWLPDGNIECLGRIDDQVKVRGYRIEPGEIETVLLQSGLVSQAVVLAVGDDEGNKRLAGYIVPRGSFDKEAITSWLYDKLPEYMVPALWVEMETLPVTANGKIDRKALPDPDATATLTNDFVAPQNEFEEKLAGIWQELLGVDQVGMLDNFFELGGDSIITIQVVSRMRQLGYQLEVGDVFTYQTITGLSEIIAAKPATSVPGEQGLLTGSSGLLPIQRWFLEKENAAVSHYSQKLLIFLDKSVTEQVLKAAVEQITTHHDALRFRYYQQGGLWQQEYGSLKANLLIEDLGHASQSMLDDLMTKIAVTLAAGIDITKGALISVALIKTPVAEEKNRLLIVIHHLAVDGVSWRILLDDLESLINRLTSGQRPALGHKSSSYRQWYQALQNYGNSSRLSSQTTYWEQVVNSYSSLRVDNGYEGKIKLKDTGKFIVTLEAGQTRRLLQEVPRVYHTEMNDMLLCALAKTICEWNYSDNVIIGLEGHGREQIEEGIDTSHTIGWFTTLFPVLLKIDKDKGTADLIKSVKEHLRQVPDKGLGYGVLKYMCGQPSLQHKEPWELVFNYLGQFDNISNDSKSLVGSVASAGAAFSEEQLVDEKLSVNCMVLAGELSLTWTFSKKHFEQHTIQQIAENYLSNLQSLIAHCLEEGRSGQVFTPSDFGLGAIVSYEELDNFLAEPFKDRPRKDQVESLYPLSGLQQGILFYGLYDTGSGTYISDFSCNLTGVDLPLFRAGWQSVMKRHSILRSAFYYDAFTVPLQCVYKEVELPVTVLDYRQMSEAEQLQAIKKYEQEDIKKGFSFNTPPLMRLALIRLSEKGYRMIWTFHHILLDGWSMPIVLEEFLTAYELLLAGKEVAADQEDRFQDYISYIERGDKEIEKKYWHHYLENVQQNTLLPFIGATSQRTKGSGETASILLQLDSDITKQIQNYSQKNRVTVNTMMQGVWSYLLHRYTGSNDIVYGVTVSGRPDDLQNVEQRVGMYINTLPLYTQIKQGQEVAAWLRDMQEEQVSSRQFQYTPLQDIQEWSAVQGDLFDSILVFENYPISKIISTRPWVLEVEDISIHDQNNYPLTIAINNSDQINIQFYYNTNLLDEFYVNEIRGHFEYVLLQMVNNEISVLGDISLLTPSWKQRLLLDFNDSFVDYPKDKTIIDLFEAQVLETPRMEAVLFGEYRLDYKELNERSNQLAHYLKSQGVKKETLVAICIERSVEMIVAILGILKAGGAYLPIDSDYPNDRIEYILEDSGVEMLLTSKMVQSKLHTHLVDLIELDGDWELIGGHPAHNLKVDIDPRQLAYVIYTSGSTGKPKGVMIEHIGIVNLALSQAEALQLKPGLKTLQFASFGFDASCYEIFNTLLSGGTLVLCTKEDILSPERFEALINTHQVQVAVLPPSYQPIIAANLGTLQTIVSAGEPLNETIGKHIQSMGIRLINAYGPTENTVCVTLTDDPVRADHTIVIGKPISNVQVYILDKEGELLSPGISGEICVGGVQLARGYLNRRELTEEKFISNPFSNEPGSRLYKTGDVGRWTPDGNLECLGRIDDQLKIRGYRIEPGEIETVLLQSGLVSQAVVLAKEDKEGNKQLAGYVVAEGAFDKEAITNYLYDRLPEHMVPGLWAELKSIPVTANGKIDKKALANLDINNLSTNEYIAGRNETEKKLAEIWKELLEIERVGVNDDFFELGGHSLLAVRVLSAIRKQFAVELSINEVFELPTIALMSARLESKTGAALHPVIEIQPRPDLIPLSYSQERLWFIDQLEGSLQYHVPAVLKLKGKLNTGALVASLQTIINRHEVLRTVIREQQGQGYQYIMDEDGWQLDIADGDKFKEDDAALQQLIQQTIRKPFDLSRDYKLRASLIQIDEQEHVLVVTMHHIASDAWSLSIIVKEFVEIYNAHHHNRPVNLPVLQFQYADYAIWQRNFLQGNRLDQKVQYWEKKLEAVPALQLPTDFMRPAVRGTRGASLNCLIEKHLSEQLQDLSQRQGCTLFMTLLAAFNVLLYRYSGQQDICVGTSTGNRPMQEVEGLVGFFVNTLALRSEVNGDAVFTDLLHQVKTTTLEAYEHQELPFEKVVETVVKDRDPSRSPLFQVMLVLLNTPEIVELRLGDVELTHESFLSKISKFDITFFISETSDGLHLTVEYSTDLYAAETIERMMDHFNQLLQSVVKMPHLQIGLLPMLGSGEQHRLLQEFSGSQVAYPTNKTILDLFEEQVQKAPGNTAVKFEDTWLSYSELNERSNQLAHYLQKKGVKAGTLVPICMERSMEMLVAILGIAKAGGAYVPIDTDFPPERISYMLEDTSARIVVSSKSSSSKIYAAAEATVDIIELDDDANGLSDQSIINPEQTPTPDQLAYVIYTSGSTGKPKGVMIEHHSLVDYVFGLNQRTGIDQCSSYALVSTIATDLGNTVIYSSLVFGGTLHIFSKETVSNTSMLHQYFRTHAIDCLKIVPSHWKALCEDERLLLPAKLLVFGGEALPADYIEDIKQSGSSCRVVNHYGPTETTIGKLLHLVNDETMYNGTVPIGRPFSNTNVYVLSKELQLCPVGVLGQLYIAGNGLARGYLNNTTLTNEKFIKDPFSKEENTRMYSTGDLVKWLPDGNILFAGRVDDQVKIRGYRVELGEIETVLQQCEEVSQAVVLAREDRQGNKRLVGYIVPSGGWLNRDGIQEYLKQQLPDYMIPATLVELDQLPLTANGKVDRKALPDPEATELAGDQYEAPRNETERKLAAIWEDVLEVEQVGIQDDFFVLGGHSLLAIRLISAIRKELNVEIPISDVFDYPTIAALSTQLEKQVDRGTLPSIKEEQRRPDEIPLSFSQERLWFIDQMDGSVQYHVPAVLKLTGDLNTEALSYALEQIVLRHEVLRTVIREKDGQSFQQIKKEGNWKLNLIDDIQYKTNPSLLQEYIQQLIQQPFDLSNDDMIRAHLITLASIKDHILVVTLHHIASDGWSRSVLVKELVGLYESFENGRPSTLKKLPIQYADYAIWQRKYLQGETFENKLGYWKTQLAGVATLNLPTDFVRPAVQTIRGAMVDFEIDPLLLAQIRMLGQQQGTTLYMTLLAVFKVLLYRYSGQEDICVGTGTAGRLQKELEDLIGFFVNTLAMRSSVSGDMLFTDFLQAVKVTTLNAYSHQEVPFEKVVDAVVNERDLSRNPLFHVTFIVQNTPDVPELRFGNVKLSVDYFDHITSKFDLTFSITETGDKLEAVIEYNADLYRAETIGRMKGHFIELLRSVATAPNQKIKDLQLLTAKEEQDLLSLAETRPAIAYSNKSLVDLFTHQVAKTPDATAIVFEEQALSYKELDERSGELALYLQSNGLRPEMLVPLCIERGAEMIIAIMGILKAGGAYVPIDQEYPIERIKFILEDTGARLAVSNSASSAKLGNNEGLKIIEIDRDWELISKQSPGKRMNHIAPEQAAYVIYTSGSTGKPKGVVVEHRSVVNLVYAQSEYFKIDKNERILQFSNYCFDASVEQVFLALSNGASLVLFPEGLQYNTDIFEEFLQEKKITHLHATPFFLENISPGNYTGLKRVIAGGDKCRKELANRWQDKCDFYNEYGPTETTVTAIEYHYSNTDESLNVVPIGKPLPNVSAYVLDSNMTMCPLGIAGELYIGGVQVARGYLNREDLTAERFIPNIFNQQTGNRLYKTGDLVRWLPGENLEFLGRIDDQVKIHGYRIELGEIEAVLNWLDEVENSCVVAKQQDGVATRLIGYYVPKPALVQEREHELYNEQVAGWKEIHENEYVLAEAEKSAHTDPEFDILGWNDSFTREPIGAQPMREWLKDFISVVLKEQPENVLEIGCGSGLIFYPLAGKIKKYIGTDFSRHSINQISEQISKGERDYGLVELQVCAAHEISLKENEPVDTIILNSVVQYFPGGDYLGDVIKKSIALLKGNGRIIIGDVRDHRLLHLFKARLQLEKMQGTVSSKEFVWAVDQEVLKEEELCFSPEYFYRLPQLYPEITNIDIQWKQGHYINELSLYRYTVVIHVGIEKPLLEPAWETWKGENSTENIYHQLQQKNKIVAVKDVPNPRLWKERLLERLLKSNTVDTVNDLVSALENEDEETAQVMNVLKFAESNGYVYRLILDKDPLNVNLLLEQDPSDSFIANVYGEKELAGGEPYTNTPLFADINLQLQKDIKLSLLQQLPEYMVPSDWVALTKLPSTVNGKLDRVFLGQREDRVISNKLNFESPRNETEQKLAAIWQEFLHLDGAGIHDNFFELGGHSLMAMRVISSIRKELDVELAIKDLFLYPTIAELSEHLLSLSKGLLLPPIKKAARPERIPLSYSQERLWFIDQMGGSIQYHIPAVLQLNGKLDVQALDGALQQIIERHQALRTVIRQQAGKAFQVIMNEPGTVINIVDDELYKNNQAELEKYVQQLIGSPFDLSKDLMLRAHLINLGEDEYILVLIIHHIASDGWSLSILVKELVELYSALSGHYAPKLGMLPVQYADYAIWQRDYLQGDTLDKKLSYWKTKLDGVSTLQLPTDYPRPAVQGTKGALVKFNIDRELTRETRDLSQQSGATLYMTLLSVFKVLLHRYSSQEDICVGSAIAGRQQEELEGLIGFFINTLAMRTRLHSKLRFTELLQVVKETTLDAYAHQEVPFEKVVEAVVKERDMSRNPVFQVTFVVQNTPDVPELRLGDVALAVLNYEHLTTKFDITFSITETKDGLDGVIEYNTDLYDVQTIARMAGHFKELLQAVVKAPEERIGNFQLLPASERHELLIEYNSQNPVYPKDKSLVELFEEQANKSPGNIALVFRQEELTYSELDERSNQLAHYLQGCGVKDQMLVPICIERSTQMIVAILGILKAGGAYVPIDPEYPLERIRFILEDTGSKLAISSNTSRALLTDASSIDIVEIDGDWPDITQQPTGKLPARVQQDNLAYVIYTSGSTGKPKGVMIEHGSVVNLIFAQGSYFDINADDRILQFSNYCFDASVEQIFLALFNGAALILLPEGLQYDIDIFEKFLQQNKITHLHATPFFLENIRPGNYETLKRVIAGGDKCRKELAMKWQDKYDFYNEYGPTETTVTAIEYYAGNTDENYSSVPIGKPLPNVTVYVLDKNMALCPRGVPGELYIGGVQVARGYLNRADLTAERFIVDIFSKEKGGRLYKTGDIGRWLPSGNIEYLGRMDDQVKVRGYRIELGEIENVLQQGNLVKQSVILAKETEKGTSQLIAYIVPEDNFSRDAVITYLRSRLPEYMVPQLWIELEHLPLTSNGKVDKKALPEVEGQQNTNEYVEPRNKIEKKLAETWQKLLGIDRAGIHDNFFELGGDSILTIQVVSRMRREGYELLPADIFIYQTISRISTAIAERTGSKVTGEQGILTGLSGLLPVQQWYLEDVLEEISHFNQALIFEIGKLITPAMLQLALEQLTIQHDALRFRYKKVKGRWQQEYGSSTGNLATLDLQSSPVSELSNLIKKHTAHEQRLLDIENGELIRVLLIHTPATETANRVFIMVHHLAIDGVSWRILLEDLEIILAALSEGRAIPSLGEKSSSYRQWYQALEKYGQSPALLSQQSYWYQAVKSYQPLIADKNHTGRIGVKEIRSFTIKLTADQTRRLLQDVPRVYHTEINDLLLCALAITIGKRNDTRKVVICLEGHGREYLDDAIDINNTVGWFTTLYPLLLNTTGANSAGDLIKTVKEQLRQVPDKGIGYGVLRYINRDESLQGNDPWDIQFNYLGQLDNVVKESKWLSIAEESTGAGRSEEQAINEKLSVTSFVKKGELMLNWNYSTLHFYEETIKALTSDYLDQLNMLIEHCMEQAKTGVVYTPSDYGLGADISYTELDAFLEDDNADNILSF